MGKWFSDLVIYTTSITLESCKHVVKDKIGRKEKINKEQGF